MSRARRVYRKKIYSLLPYGVFIFIPFVLFLILFQLFSSQDKAQGNGGIISPLAQNGGMKAITKALPGIIGKKNEDKAIQEAVEEILDSQNGTYSVIYKNLKTGDEFRLNPTKVYESASLYKLFVMAKTYEDLEKGEFSENTVLQDSVERLNQRFGIASEEAELTQGSFKMSVTTALSQMITISHNYAALLLTSKLKTSEIKKFIKENGFDHTDFTAPPKTTPEDIELFYQKLYEGKIVSQASSREMIDLLKRQELNDRIPKYLPKGTPVAHKTGELGGMKHDAGIVFSKKGDYILILMSDTKAPLNAAEVEAKISDKVYSIATQ